jgi:protein-S-isoprenylcysteine O-methyltransferase Ste14
MASLVRSTIVSALFGLFVGPGPIAVIIPWFISGWRVELATGAWILPQLLGVVMIAGGLPALLASIARFVHEGRGTLAPIVPTEKLVIRGAYRLVRNPMYIAVLAMIFGQSLVFQSWALVAYGTMVAVVFDLFVRFYEEPALQRTFGDEYVRYCAAVSRWAPRSSPWRGEGPSVRQT